MAVDQSIERRLGRLRIWNLVVGLVLAVQAIMMAALTNSFSLPVTATFMKGPPGTKPELHQLFNIATGWGVFTFLAISAIALLLISSPLVFPWYKRNLLQSRNYGRWIEYFFSSSIMIVLISQIRGSAREVRKTGQAELASLLVRQLCRHHTLDRHSNICCGAGTGCFTARFRLWHHRLAVCFLQLFCCQYDIAV
jgi:hypothetical protein